MTNVLLFYVSRLYEVEAGSMDYFVSFVRAYRHRRSMKEVIGLKPFIFRPADSPGDLAH